MVEIILSFQTVFLRNLANEPKNCSINFQIVSNSTSLCVDVAATELPKVEDERTNDSAEVSKLSLRKLVSMVIKFACNYKVQLTEGDSVGISAFTKGREQRVTCARRSKGTQMC